VTATWAARVGETTNWTAIATAAIGAVAVLAGGWLVSWMARRNVAQQEMRASRREFYREMLTLLINRRKAIETLSWATTEPAPPDFDQAVIDAHDARLELDASEEVRRLGRPCFALMQRFWMSHAEQMPIDVDENGFYVRHYELVRGQDQDTIDLHMRLALGHIHDDLMKAIDALADQMRSELRG